jgi:hypothetical protein
MCIDERLGPMESRWETVHKCKVTPAYQSWRNFVFRPKRHRTSMEQNPQKGEAGRLHNHSLLLSTDGSDLITSWR